MLTIKATIPVEAFFAELTKVARVAKAVKQYRRAMQILAEAPHASTARVFHGTKPEHIQKVLSEGVLKPHAGAHGVGTYMWKHRTRQTYMHTVDERSPGFAIRRALLGKIKSPKDPNPHKLDRAAMLISDKSVRIPPRSSVKATPKQLKEGREGIKRSRLRQVDSAIWTRAEADTAAKRAGEDIIAPSKRELVRLLQRKDAPPKFRFIRSRPGTKENEEFLDSYFDALS